MRDRTSNDLCTPGDLLALVRMVSPIALDPCSNPWSQVGALLAFDEDSDGLAQPWAELTAGKGQAYVNPPYGRGHMEKWAGKIAVEAQRGCEITALVKGDFSTGWWDTLRRYAAGICYLEGRPAFEGGESGSGKFASAMFYFGRSRYLFAHVFEHRGDVRLLG